jgi:hypothetical protein
MPRSAAVWWAGHRGRLHLSARIRRGLTFGLITCRSAEEPVPHLTRHAAIGADQKRLSQVLATAGVL